MSLLFEKKADMDNGTYVALCDGLKKIHTEANKITENPMASCPSWFDATDVGAYFIMSPDLFPQFCFDVDQIQTGLETKDKDLCVRFDGMYQQLPDDAHLGQSETFTQFGRCYGWEFPDRKDWGGPYFKFSPNVHVIWWSMDPDSHDTPVDDESVLWLAPWMLHHLEPVGDGWTYTHVFTFPNAHGAGFPKVAAMV